MDEEEDREKARSVGWMEIQGMLDGESRAGGTGWERSDGDTGWGHQMGTWQRGTPPGTGWMEMLGEEGSFFPSFTIFFTFLTENNPRNLFSLPPLTTGPYSIQMGSIPWILGHFYNPKAQTHYK